MPEPTATADPAPPVPIPGGELERWMLDPSLVMLNHGSFGARLRAVVARHGSLREELEARPVEFLDRRGQEMMRESRGRVGAMLGMKPCDFGFTTNATDGVNAVIRSLDLKPGDELVMTNHVYPAVRSTMEHLAKRVGAIVREAMIELPVSGGDAVLSAIENELSERTTLVCVDHLTSPTALRFPVEEIVALCAARGIDVLVDGAHIPGMFELDVDSIGAAYYTGNLHKWICSPPGAGFLWVRKDRQETTHPSVLSLYLDEGFETEFSWQGTRDTTTWHVVPEAMRIMKETVEGGWPAVMKHNHALATWAQAALCRAWDVQPISPRDGSMLGSMASVTLPDALRQRFETFRECKLAILERGAIEVPVIDWPDRWMVRVSCQVYNRPEQYERLAECVKELLTE